MMMITTMTIIKAIQLTNDDDNGGSNDENCTTNR